MVSASDTVKVAVIQCAPLPFDREGSVEKVIELTKAVGVSGAKLALFPEAYVGGYPWGLAFGTAIGGRSPAGRRTWERCWSTAIDVPGPETDRLGEAAREAGLYLAVGVVERDSSYSRGT
ncbi:MAG: nitrilase, partial [Gemmatimonadales bacterium]